MQSGAAFLQAALAGQLTLTDPGQINVSVIPSLWSSRQSTWVQRVLEWPDNNCLLLSSRCLTISRSYYSRNQAKTKLLDFAVFLWAWRHFIYFQTSQNTLSPSSGYKRWWQQFSPETHRRWLQKNRSKLWYPSLKLHRVTSHKALIITITVLRKNCLLGNGQPFKGSLIYYNCIPKSKSKSKSCYDRRSVSMSWCQVHSGARDQMLYSVWTLLCCLCGAPSLTRGRICLVSHFQQCLVHCQRFNIIYIVHVTCFKYM
jgi:hypothetical protein